MERKNIKKQYRYIELDILRGLAIVMMIIYHFLFDLEYLGKLPAISLYTGFWKGFQISTAGLFLFLVGVSLTLSYNKRLKKFLKNREYSIRHAERRMTEGSLSSNIVLRDPSVVSTLAQDDVARKLKYIYFPFIKRGVLVFSLGLLISIVANLANFGNIDFGILHFIGFSIVLSLLFIRFTWINIFLTLLIFTFSSYFESTRSDNLIMFFLGSHPVGYTALDYFSIFPWYGFVLLGIAVGNLWYLKNSQKAKNLSISLENNIPMPIKNNLALLGKNSLIIYLLHQPLLFGVLYFVGL